MNSSLRELLIICDSSPLILLAKVDQLGLFRAMADEVWIPAAVWAEVVVKGAGRPEAAMVAAQFAAASPPSTWTRPFVSKWWAGRRRRWL
jgi:hypothetical protein